MFAHQTMFDGVWSPNISRLSRPLWRTLNFVYRTFNGHKHQIFDALISIHIITRMTLYFFFGFVRKARQDARSPVINSDFAIRVHKLEIIVKHLSSENRVCLLQLERKRHILVIEEVSIASLGSHLSVICFKINALLLVLVTSISDIY